ncbi:hypothetical protein RYA07_09775, partial [Pseudomonas syringae pv. actinidiae]
LGLSHVVSLRLLRHLARDTFFRGKVKLTLDILFYYPVTDLPGLILATHIDGNHKIPYTGFDRRLTRPCCKNPP